MSQGGKDIPITPSGTRRGDWFRALTWIRRNGGGSSWEMPKGAVMHHGIQPGRIQIVPFGLHGSMEHGGSFSENPIRPASAPPLGDVRGPGPLTDGGPALREMDVRALEADLKLPLDGDYRQFLLTQNGGRPSRPAFLVDGRDRGECLGHFFGLEAGPDASLRGALKIYAGRIAQGLLPIACDPFGNLILLGLADPQAGQVLFWDHEEEEAIDGVSAGENIRLVAPSFASFLDAFRNLADGAFVTVDHLDAADHQYQA